MEPKSDSHRLRDAATGGTGHDPPRAPREPFYPELDFEGKGKDVAVSGSLKVGAIVSWVNQALREERDVLELRHMDFVSKLAKSLESGTPPGTASTAPPHVLLPGVVDSDPDERSGDSWMALQFSPSPPSAPHDPPGLAAPELPGAVHGDGKKNGVGSKQIPEETPDQQSEKKISDQPEDAQTSLSTSHKKRGSFLDGETLYDESDNMVRRFIKGQGFEVLFAGLIIANTVIMVFESQYYGFELGHGLPAKLTGYDMPASKMWPNAKTVFMVFEIGFGAIFTIELLLKLYAFKKQFFCDAWSYMDSAIVISWFLDVLDMAKLPISPLVLRLVRLIRLTRLIRIIRNIKGFGALYFMVTAIRAALAVLVWSVVLLTIGEVVLALVMTNLLKPWIDGDAPLEKRQLVFSYFGTFVRSAITLFQMSFGIWVTPCRVMMDNVSEWFMLFFMIYQFAVGFSVMTVIYGIFFAETFRVANTDDRIMMINAKHANNTHREKMKALFEAADEDGNGEVDIEEFRKVLDNEDVAMWLGAMNLSVNDPDQVFQLIDFDDGGTLDSVEMVQGMNRLKGAAKSYDLIVLAKEHRRTQKMLAKVAKRLQINAGEDDDEEGGDGDKNEEAPLLPAGFTSPLSTRCTWAEAWVQDSV